MKELLIAENATPGHITIVKSILDQAATIPAKRGIKQWPLSFNIKNIRTNIDSGGVFLFKTASSSYIGTVDYRSEDKLIWGNDQSKAAYLHRLAVRPSHSGQGFGKQIINWAITKATAEDKDFLRLDCVASNGKLRAYYESLSFSCSRVIECRGGVTALYELALDHS